MFLRYLLSLLGGYLLGNLNGAVCASRLMNDDVRSHGSGNAGLTNFIRNYGASKAFLVILVDAGKAVLACLLGRFLLRSVDMARIGVLLLGAEDLKLFGMALGGLGVLLGHCFPVFLGFRGGKGILSGVFVALMLDWPLGLAALGIFILVYLISGYVSLSSVVAASGLAVLFAVFHWDDPAVMICAVAMCLLTVFMHRSNIVRLLKGEEHKTNLFKKGSGK